MSVSFIASARFPDEYSGPAWWFVVRNRKLLVSNEEQHGLLPFINDINEAGISPVSVRYLGALNGRPCFAADVSEDVSPATGFSFHGLRGLHGHLPDDLYRIAFRAVHISEWYMSHLYCAQCGTTLIDEQDVHAKKCPHCGYMSFPPISPAIIVLVERDSSILLARSGRFQEGMYSVIAGFSEPGETLEQTVEREVMEETGIEVKNIKYFGSQPWPFPNSLMIAFTAEYASGAIQIDGVEIEDAGWFTIDNLPLIPGEISIARSLIDWYIRKSSSP